MLTNNHGWCSDTEFIGSSARLIQVKRYSGTFSCQFDVFRYPFDIQECTMVSSLSTGDPTQVLLKYIGDNNLQEYNIKDFKILLEKEHTRETIMVCHMDHYFSDADMHP